MESGIKRGVIFGLLSALLFGLSTPAAKLLLDHVSVQMLAGLFYLGSGLGLTIYRTLSPSEGKESKLTRTDFPWLAAATLTGGVIAPVILLWSLSLAPAEVISLLLTLEGVFTALIAWIVFKENCDRRVVFGMLAISTGAAFLSFTAKSGVTLHFSFIGPLLAIAACACWALDNNLTRRISGSDPVQIASIKGLVAGGVNILLALFTGAHFPHTSQIAFSLVVGFFGYGVSLVLFILALRNLGAARASAYFSAAPFLGAAASLCLWPELPGSTFWIAAALIAIGVWCHLSEQHEHFHAHEEMEHDHPHVHDSHHQHMHLPGDPAGEPHTHKHRHPAMKHSHPHVPDIHHRHSH